MINQIQNNPLEILILTLILVTFIIFVMVAALPFFIKKGVNVSEYIKTADNVVDKAGIVVAASDKILPDNPTINILKLITDWAQKAVHGAEQLYIASQLPPDQRKEKAKETIYAALKLSNVNITPELEKVIDGAIEAEVLALGHTKIYSISKTEASEDVSISSIQSVSNALNQ